MRVLVYPSMMTIGGSQINALELAQQTVARGHEVTFFGHDGPLVEVVREQGFEVVPARRDADWPSAANMAQLVALVRARRPDVVHGYEWRASMELAWGPVARLGVPLVVTVMSMNVEPMLPRLAPLVVGTAELADQQRAAGRDVTLIEPPVDTALNAPGVTGPSPRTVLGLDPAAELVVAVVGRLEPELGKLGGVLEAIDVTARLGRERRVVLIVVGGGSGLDEVRGRAAAVNGDLGRPAVVVTGPLLDPRTAYDAADVMLGMGSSALKSMAFARPLVVQGEEGFWQLADDDTLPGFLARGWHGRGRRADLFTVLTELADAPQRRQELSGWGRRLVVERYDLGLAGRTQLGVYEHALARHVSLSDRRSDAAGAATRYARFRARRARVELGRRRRAAVAAVGARGASGRPARSSGGGGA
ncbi:MAG: glycosyltransferase family 4 protein [Actinobacteria bacterium]|nr:glycosyltransferase family 4 protein [Actinomycetota bacterium]